MRLINRDKTNTTVRHLPLIFLAIELLDELVGGVLEPAWPLIRHDLNLSYGQVGLLLSFPSLVSLLIEPALGIWADMGYRRRLMVIGGMGFGTALFILAFSSTFSWFLVGLVGLSAGSSGLVPIAQVALMELTTACHEYAMARWTLVGSLGSVLGPLLLVGATTLNLVRIWSTRRFPAHPFIDKS